MMRFRATRTKKMPQYPMNPNRLAGWLTIIFLCLGFATQPTFAQPAQGKRIAFVVGNAKYANESALANPHNDARLLAATLKNDLRFDEVIVREDLGRAQLYDLVTEINRKAKGADAVVVYYSGHGMRGVGGNYLIPVDARISDEDHIERDGLPASRIVDALQNSNARVALLVLDACRDSPYAKRTRSGSKGLTRMNVSGGNVLVAYATTEGNTADDGSSGNSPYAKALSEALKQTQQSVLSQLDTVRRNVRQVTAGKQNPTREGDLEVNVYLINPTIAINNSGPTTVGRTDPEDEAYGVAKLKNTRAGWEAMLAAYPNGRYAGVARIALAEAVVSPPVERQTTQAPAPAPAPVATGTSGGGVISDCADCPEIVVIPAGSFMMGSNDFDDREKPAHRVNVASFALGKTEVTQGQWKALMGSNPSRFTVCGDDCPVEKVSWDDAQEYIERLSAKTGKRYSLPSEAQWEYAARGGTSTQWSSGDSESDLGDYAWYNKNSGLKTQPVGQKRANGYGLHDMHGNVWEWTQDCWHANYSGAPSDSSAWLTNCNDRMHVLRGGSWVNNPLDLRAADRNWFSTDFRDFSLGFRVARTVLP